MIRGINLTLKPTHFVFGIQPMKIPDNHCLLTNSIEESVSCMCVCVCVLTSILSDVSDPGQGLIAALLNDLQVAYLYRGSEAEEASGPAAEPQLNLPHVSIYNTRINLDGLS